MKLKNLIPITFSLLLIFSGGAGVNANEQEINEKYIYPVEPGTEEWASLETSDEKRELSNIPKHIVDNMSTEALIESVLDYPLLPDIFAFNTIEQGIETVSQRFSGLKALLERENAANSLYSKFTTQTTYSDEITFDNMVIEALLSYKDINRQFSEGQVSEIIEKTDVMDSTTYLKGLQEQISLLDMSGSVKTPNGSIVPTVFMTYELNAIERKNLDDQMAIKYPKAVRKSTASRRYNCHSYAWYSQSPLSNTHWINAPFVNTYMTDGSYRRTNSFTNNARIFYTTDDHSGIITGSQVTSKWGSAGVYLHNVKESPYNGSGTTYWIR